MACPDRSRLLTTIAYRNPPDILCEDVHAFYKLLLDSRIPAMNDSAARDQALQLLSPRTSPMLPMRKVSAAEILPG